MTNKKYGRVGDTALIGLGTYADDRCAVSGTGHGEFFMLGVTAYDVAARMKYKGLSLAAAAEETIDRLTSLGGDGGLIAVDMSGNISLPFNCDGMYRGWIDDRGEPVTEIYR
jgi:beta-aspartyl-peptidase (threonine type)